MIDSHSHVVMAGLVPATHGNVNESAKLEPLGIDTIWVVEAA
jgi:hypothetical protein